MKMRNREVVVKGKNLLGSESRGEGIIPMDADIGLPRAAGFYYWAYARARVVRLILERQRKGRPGILLERARRIQRARRFSWFSKLDPEGRKDARLTMLSVQGYRFDKWRSISELACQENYERGDF